MRRAIALSRHGMATNAGGPFGAVVAQDGVIVGEGYNQVATADDPTAHAEIVAIRAACRDLGRFDLRGCEIYTSCEPCPMCLGAIYWAGIKDLYYAATVDDALKYGNFDDSMIYSEIRKPANERENMKLTQIMQPEAVEVWKEYAAKTDRVQY